MNISTLNCQKNKNTLAWANKTLLLKKKKRERERESQIHVGICYHQWALPTVANTHWVFPTVVNTHQLLLLEIDF